jgi:hypothetical protein
MKTVAVMLKPISNGWAVTLTDGQELARFTGFAAHWRALRYATQRWVPVRLPNTSHPPPGLT